MAVLTKAEIESLSPQERLALIDELWQSLDEASAQSDSGGDTIPEWQRRILDERLLDLDEHPEDDLSLAEARAQSIL
jgi:putative addiction module component (TIGR02574 family)